MFCLYTSVTFSYTYQSQGASSGILYISFPDAVYILLRYSLFALWPYDDAVVYLVPLIYDFTRTPENILTLHYFWIYTAVI